MRVVVNSIIIIIIIITVHLHTAVFRVFRLPALLLFVCDGTGLVRNKHNTVAVHIVS